MLCLSTGDRSREVPGAVDDDAVEVRAAGPLGTISSTGSSSGRGMPHRYAAERCEANALGTASTAAAIDCSRFLAVPRRRATPGCSASKRPSATARYQPARLMPASLTARRVTSPWWASA